MFCLLECFACWNQLAVKWVNGKTEVSLLSTSAAAAVAAAAAAAAVAVTAAAAAAPAAPAAVDAAAAVVIIRSQPLSRKLNSSSFLKELLFILTKEC